MISRGVTSKSLEKFTSKFMTKMTMKFHGKISKGVISLGVFYVLLNDSLGILGKVHMTD